MKLRRFIWKLFHPGQRYGRWQLTWSGRQFYPGDPRPEDICIEDIAHHNSLVCRFSGCVRFHYSVNQHSLLVERLVTRMIGDEPWTVETRLKALLHDCTESYTQDIPKPAKLLLPDFNRMEKEIWVASCNCFGLDPCCEPIIKVADTIALVTERNHLLPPSPHRWKEQDKYDADMSQIIQMSPGHIELLFHRKFLELNNLRQSHKTLREYVFNAN